MIIDAISDLHGYYPTLEGGDLLIVAGDLTARDTPNQYAAFVIWLQSQRYSKRIVIGGNHDNFLQQNENWSSLCNLGFEYLCDSGTEFTHYPLLEVREEGKQYERKTYKIWGSPWTRKFPGMNPHCMAFTCDTEKELAEKWALIPQDTDILITHGPSKLMHDETIDGRSVGSESLLRWIANHSNTLKLHAYGHIHEAYGVWDQRKIQKQFNGKEGPIFINASHVNERYQPVNKPIRVVL